MQLFCKTNSFYIFLFYHLRILNPRSFLTVFQGGNDCLLCAGKCPLYLILTNGGEIALGSWYSKVFPFRGWIPSQQVAAATSKGEFDIAANSPCSNPCNCASTYSLCSDYLLKVNSLSIQSTACFPEYKQGPQRRAGGKDLRVKPCQALHRLQAATSSYSCLLGSRQGAASHFLKEPFGCSNWGKDYCCLWFRKKGGRTGIGGSLCLTFPIYKVWVTIFYLLQRDVCKLMDRKRSETPHLSSWDMLAIRPIAFRYALPKQQWAINGINALSLMCWLLPRCCVVCVICREYCYFAMCWELSPPFVPGCVEAACDFAGRTAFLVEWEGSCIQALPSAQMEFG